MARVNDIRFVGYGVKDLEAEKRFYLDAWKLVEVPSDDGLIYLAAPGSDTQYCVRLRQTDEPRIDVVSWSATDRAEVDALFEQVKAAGGKPVTEPGPLAGKGGGYGFRFFDVTYASSLRPDAHAAARAPSGVMDCLHFCLPGGPVDEWTRHLLAGLFGKT